MKKILVTGGNGRFANELKKIKSAYKFFFKNKKQLNILSPKSIEFNIGRYKPNIIFINNYFLSSSICGCKTNFI